jgi:hypothetical protein
MDIFEEAQAIIEEGFAKPAEDGLTPAHRYLMEHGPGGTIWREAGIITYDMAGAKIHVASLVILAESPTVETYTLRMQVLLSLDDEHFTTIKPCAINGVPWRSGQGPTELGEAVSAAPSEVAEPRACGICGKPTSSSVLVDMPGLSVDYPVCSAECEAKARQRGADAWKAWEEAGRPGEEDNISE